MIPGGPSWCTYAPPSNDLAPTPCRSRSTTSRTPPMATRSPKASTRSSSAPRSAPTRCCARIGLTLPLQPVYGYSITAPLRRHEGHPDHGPRSALMDERHKVAISAPRRSACGWPAAPRSAAAPNRHDPRALRHALQGAARLVPRQRPAAARRRHWKGARPMLPDGPPVLGASGVPGVWLNLGPRVERLGAVVRIGARCSPMRWPAAAGVDLRQASASALGADAAPAPQPADNHA